MLKFYTLFALNVIAFLYLITNAMGELHFQPENNTLKKKYKYHKTPCSIQDDNMVCGSDLKFYPNACVAKQNGITQYRPNIVCQMELLKKYCK